MTAEGIATCLDYARDLADFEMLPDGSNLPCRPLLTNGRNLDVIGCEFILQKMETVL